MILIEYLDLIEMFIRYDLLIITTILIPCELLRQGMTKYCYDFSFKRIENSVEFQFYLNAE